MVAVSPHGRTIFSSSGAGREFEVIAVDQRGIGQSDKPAHGYDTGTVADDLVALRIWNDVKSESSHRFIVAVVYDRRILLDEEF